MDFFTGCPRERDAGLFADGEQKEERDWLAETTASKPLFLRRNR
jgi:hypothetical protein